MCDSIPVELTRPVVEQALAHDPNLTMADKARWLEMAQAEFERAFIGKSKAGGQEVESASPARAGDDRGGTRPE